METFGIDTEEAGYLGERIGSEGVKFEDIINDIERTVENCRSSWTNGGYEAFRAQTTAAASELSVLREFFRKYGSDVVGFAGESQEAINKINSIITGKF